MGQCIFKLSQFKQKWVSTIYHLDFIFTCYRSFFISLMYVINRVKNRLGVERWMKERKGKDRKE